MITENHLKLHHDHLMWKSDIKMWLQDLQIWTNEMSEILDNLRIIEKAVEHHVYYLLLLRDANIR